MSNDLSPMWIKENLEKARDQLKKTETVYSLLQNKDTQFAKGIARVAKAQREVIEIWLSA